jgi:lipopolysaccharide export system permease protein
VMSDDERFLIITLLNGYSYEEQRQTAKPGEESHPLLRTHFNSYKIRFDLSTFKLSRTNEDLFKDNYQMLNLDQLRSALDSLNRQLDERKWDSRKVLNSHYMTFRDSIFQNEAMDTTSLAVVKANNSENVYENAIGQARNIHSFLSSIDDELDSRKKLIARFAIEKERKYTLSIACFILFLIGAPLGAIIRKGGIGTPVVVSVIFFLIFHITSIMGEKFSRENVLDPQIGMWIAPALLLPVGLFLTYKATHDSALFEIEVYSRFFKRIFRKK